MKPSRQGLAWAVGRAKQAIHDNQVDELRQLISEYPDLLTWRDSDHNGGVLLASTTSYANFPGFENEHLYNRIACAELLIDAGALIDPRVYLRIIDTGAKDMLALFHRKRRLPDNLRVFAALGDEDRVRECFDASGALFEFARPDTQVLHAYDGAADDWPHPADDELVIAGRVLLCRPHGSSKDRCIPSRSKHRHQYRPGTTDRELGRQRGLPRLHA